MAGKFLKVIAGRPMYRAGRKWEQGLSYALIEGKVRPEAFEGDPNFTAEVVDSIPGADASQAAANIADTNMKKKRMEELDA